VNRIAIIHDNKGARHHEWKHAFQLKLDLLIGMVGVNVGEVEVTQARLIADRLLSDAVFPDEGPTWKRGPMERMAVLTIVDQLLNNGKLTNPEAVNISPQFHRGLVVRFSSHTKRTVALVVKR
jgi:hypothetical protein